jgi:hypothetical protein
MARITFKTGKDASAGTSARPGPTTRSARHTALTALAQLRTAAIQAALAGADILPAAPPAVRNAPTAVSEPAVSATDLQIYTGTAPLPARGGQPCPPGIPPIGLSAAETARIDRLARDWKAGLISLARLAFQLRWSAWRRRHQARARWHHYSTRLAVAARDSPGVQQACRDIRRSDSGVRRGRRTGRPPARRRAGRRTGRSRSRPRRPARPRTGTRSRCSPGSAG